MVFAREEVIDHRCEICDRSHPSVKFDRYKAGTLRNKCRSCRYQILRSKPENVVKQRQQNANYALENKGKKQAYDARRYRVAISDPIEKDKIRRAGRKNASAHYYRHRELQIERTRIWALKNPDKRREQKRRYREKHGESIRADLRRRYREQRLSRQAAARLYYAENKWRSLLAQREWARRNRDRLAHYANKRRAMKAENGGSHSIAEWREKILSHKGRCAYCGKLGRALTRDHIVPLSRGGADDIANIAPACRPCNSAKAQMTLEEFLGQLRIITI